MNFFDWLRHLRNPIVKIEKTLYLQSYESFIKNRIHITPPIGMYKLPELMQDNFIKLPNGETCRKFQATFEPSKNKIIIITE